MVTHHNVIDHSPALSFGYTVYDSSKVQELYQKYDVQLNLSGHIHMQHIAQKEETYDIATSSLLINPTQYGKITINEEDSINYETNILDVDSWAKKNGIEDDNLRNYSAYSLEFFKDSGSKNFLKALEGYDDIKESDKETIAELISVVNTYYFAGQIGESREEILSSDSYKVWSSYGEQAPFKRYIDSMLEEENHNSLSIVR